MSNFYSFLNVNGNAMILQITNMTSGEFKSFWDDLRECIEVLWCAGCGRRCSYSAKDTLFMFISGLKHVEYGIILHVCLILKSPFKRIIIIILQTVSEVCVSPLLRVHVQEVQWYLPY